MNVKDAYITNRDEISKASAGLQSFMEYALSFKQKILQFIADEELTRDTGDVVSVPIQTTISDVSTTAVCLITHNQYVQALNNEDENIEVAINNAGDVVTVTGKQILDAFESTVQDLSLQYEFCDAAINNAEMTKTDFCSLIMAKYDGLAKDKVSSYLDLIEDKSSSLSLRNLFATQNLGSLQQKSVGQNTYIELSDSNEYTGQSVWIVALTNIGNTISGFFNVVWKGIMHIGDFLHSILQGLIKFGKWLLSKLFRSLTTNWDVTNHVIGIADIPVFQMHVADWFYEPLNPNKIGFKFPSYTSQLSSNYDNLPSMFTMENTRYAYQWYCKFENGNKLVFKDLAYFKTGLNQSLKAMLVRTNEENGVDKDYISECEVIIATPKDDDWSQTALDRNLQLNDWSFRLGCTSDGKVYLRIYPILQPEWLNNVTDNKIAYGMYLSWASLLHSYGQQFPIICFNHNYDLDDSDWELVRTKPIEQSYNIIIPPSVADLDTPDPFDLVGNFTYLFNATDAVNVTLDTYDPAVQDVNTTKNMRAGIVLSLTFNMFLPLMIMNSDGIDAIQNNEVMGEDGVKLFILDYIYERLPVPSAEFKACLYRWADTTEVVLNPMSTSDIADWVDTFRPYSKSKFLPTIAHYQTLAEQADEIENLIVITAIIAVAAFVAFKMHKYKIKRQNLLAIRQGALDSMSWSLGDNPSDEQLTAYRKLQKKVARTSRLNGLLGFGTSNAIPNSTFSAVGAVAEQIASVRKSNSETIPSLDSITQLITG